MPLQLFTVWLYSLLVKTNFVFLSAKRPLSLQRSSSLYSSLPFPFSPPLSIWMYIYVHHIERGKRRNSEPPKVGWVPLTLPPFSIMLKVPPSTLTESIHYRSIMNWLSLCSPPHQLSWFHQLSWWNQLDSLWLSSWWKSVARSYIFSWINIYLLYKKCWS